MLWSIDSCQKRYLLTSVTWLIAGSEIQLIKATFFFKSYPLTSYWFSIYRQVRSTFLNVELSLLSDDGKN